MNYLRRLLTQSNISYGVLLKRAVGSSLIVFGVVVSAILVLGLIVPEKTLLKLSKNGDTRDGIIGGQGEQVGAFGVVSQSGATPEHSNSDAASGSTAATGPTTQETAVSTSNTPSLTSPSGGSSTTVAPSLTFGASPTTISSGSSSVLSWSIAAGASPTPTCTASGGWSGAKATSGSQNVSPGSTTTYVVTCSNSAGQSTKSVTVTVNVPASSCGSGGACSLSDVAGHSTAADCWMIVKYTAGGGNGTGKVYKIASNFFGSSGSHDGLPGAPPLTASMWCGKDISSTFNSKHNGGSRTSGSNNAIWWLTNNGNSYIADWSGN